MPVFIIQSVCAFSNAVIIIFGCQQDGFSWSPNSSWHSCQLYQTSLKSSSVFPQEKPRRLKRGGEWKRQEVCIFTEWLTALVLRQVTIYLFNQIILDFELNNFPMSLSCVNDFANVYMPERSTWMFGKICCLPGTFF